MNRFIQNYGTVVSTSWKDRIIETIFATLVTGYNHTKYWIRRNKIQSDETNLLKRLYYFYYIKRCDAKHLSSFGTTMFGGATFITPPSATWHEWDNCCCRRHNWS